METEALQHALSHMLHHLRQQMADLNAAIAEVEVHLTHVCPSLVGKSPRPRDHERDTQMAVPAADGRKTGGRDSAGWTADARALVSTRMSAYWRGRRNQKDPLASSTATDAEKGQGAAQDVVRAAAGRSTAGWTPQARAEAAARMRERWLGHKNVLAHGKERPCD